MKICTPEFAISFIKDGDTVAVGGSGAGHTIPDRLLQTVAEAFKEYGHPRNLTFLHPCGVGDNDSRGLNHIAIEGLVKRDIGGFWGNAPKLSALALANKINGYNFPQGVLTHMLRAIANNDIGLLTKVGLNTFVDPDYEGGKVNEVTKEDLVFKVKVLGEEHLFYKTIPVNVAFIRGSYADEEGNITMEEEVGVFSMISLAQAARVNNGIVIAQVRKVKIDYHAAPERVRVPGVLVDFIVEEPNQSMTFITEFDKALIDRTHKFIRDDLVLHGIKRVISRRAAMEIKMNGYVNLGYGIPDGVPIALEQEDLLKRVTLMIEQGPIGGILTTGLNFGAMYNPSAIIDDGYQFDFFHGGGLDVCYLGFAQVDKNGNVNSSRFGNTLTGCGGFIDISQNAKKVVFCGAFTAKSEIEVNDYGIKIINGGKHKKFVDRVQQVTFNGMFEASKGKKVIYVTERAVFNLTTKGVELIEIAPGADLEKDILAFMDFKPLMNSIKLMDPMIFSSEKGLLESKILEINE